MRKSLHLYVHTRDFGILSMDTIESQDVETVHSSPTCLIHFEEEEGRLTTFTKNSFEKFLTSHEQWITLDGQQQKIAERTNDIVRNVKSSDQPLHVIQNLHYHRKCYSKFTNVTLIKRAQSRCSKQSVITEADCGKVQETNNEQSLPPKKLMRSGSSNSFKSRNKNVLPSVCLICQKENMYITDQVRTCLFVLIFFTTF